MKKFFTMLTLITVAQTALAGAPKPDHCPSVAAIVSAGLSEPYIDHDSGGWMVFKDYQYLDTKEKWGFVIGNIPAESKDEAYSKAVKSLQSLRLIGEPQELMGVWMCAYETSEKYIGSAFTDPSQSVRPSSILRHVKF